MMFEMILGFIFGVMVTMFVVDVRNEAEETKCRRTNDVYKCEYIYVPVKPEAPK